MAEQEDATAAPKAAKGRKLVFLLGGLVLLLAGGAAAAYFTGMIPGLGPHAEAATPHEGEAPSAGHGPDEASAPAVAFVDMPDLIVNLQSEPRRMRFLKLRLALEVEGGPMAEKVRALLPRVMDGFQVYLRALTPEELNGSAGVQRLKEELVARANLAVEPLKVGDVLLKEMLVQ
jgi:flagellar FliL protein